MSKVKSEIPFFSDNRFYLELIVVLVIVILLITIAVPYYNSTIQLTGDQVDEANIRILNSATLQWLLTDEANNPQNIDTMELQAELTRNYLRDWPVSPNGRSYTRKFSRKGSRISQRGSVPHYSKVLKRKQVLTRGLAFFMP